MFSLKPGVRVSGVEPELLLGLVVVQQVFSQNNFDMVITELTGGKHMEESLHYRGLAADLRSKHINASEIKHKIVKIGSDLLGENYDFFLENENSSNEHFHLEFQG